MESILSSFWLLVSSPPVVPADLTSQSIEGLERLRSALIPYRDADLSLLVWATIFVTIGVLMEIAEIQHDVRDAICRFKGGSGIGELGSAWKLVVAVGWVLVAGGLCLEWWGDARINSVAEDLDRINDTIVERTRDFSVRAEASAHNAAGDAGQAKKDARSAQTLARDARIEADSLKNEIVSANDKAADAVSRLAGAERRLADATQREANAEEKLKWIKTPRSLINSEKLMGALKPFKGTEYVFNVFMDDESIEFTKAVARTLDAAGWVRKQPAGINLGIPTMEIVFGTGTAEHVPACVDTGISIRARTKNSLATLQAIPFQLLPKTVQASLVLKNSIAESISPPDERNVMPGTIDPKPGEEGPLWICVGKKP